jgi:hypothetical protein
MGLGLNVPSARQGVFGSGEMTGFLGSRVTENIRV